MSQLNNFTIDQLVSFSAQNSKALSYFGMCKRQEVFVQDRLVAVLDTFLNHTERQYAT